MLEGFSDEKKAAILLGSLGRMVQEAFPNLKYMVAVDDGKNLHMSNNIESGSDKYIIAEAVMMKTMGDYQKELGIECEKEFCDVLDAKREEWKAQDA